MEIAMRAAEPSAVSTPAEPQYTVSKHAKGCCWEVRDAGGELVCLTVYRRGAREVVRRLSLVTGVT